MKPRLATDAVLTARWKNYAALLSVHMAEHTGSTTPAGMRSSSGGACVVVEEGRAGPTKAAGSTSGALVGSGSSASFCPFLFHIEYI